jgi:hypothetical protein
VAIKGLSTPRQLAIKIEAVRTKAITAAISGINPGLHHFIVSQHRFASNFDIDPRHFGLRSGDPFAQLDDRRGLVVGILRLGDQDINSAVVKGEIEFLAIPLLTAAEEGAILGLSGSSRDSMESEALSTNRCKVGSDRDNESPFGLAEIGVARNRNSG